MQLPSAVLFDLDNTLAQSKQAIAPSMAALLEKLLARTNVGIISGGKLAQLAKQAADHVPATADLTHLYLLPTSGAALFFWREGAWEPVYEKQLTPEEGAKVEAALREGASSTGLVDFSQQKYGAYIENRGAQVSLSALGQEAPLKEKVAWDPSHEKRVRLQARIAPLLPEFDVKIGGLTTIDVTLKGVNKAYGVRAFAQHLGVSVDQMLYLGDELGEHGNDAVVKETGIPALPVASPKDTEHLIERLLALPS